MHRVARSDYPFRILDAFKRKQTQEFIHQLRHLTYKDMLDLFIAETELKTFTFYFTSEQVEQFVKMLNIVINSKLNREYLRSKYPQIFI